MRGRTNNFDALRLMGAIAVLAAHQFYVQGYEMPYVIGFKHLGTVAVYMFFSASGYLVAKSWESDPNLFRYTARRFLRMAPGFVVMAALSLLAQQAMGSSTFDSNPLYQFNSPLWTLKWEVLCYAGLAVLAMAMPMRIAGLITMACLLMYWRSTVFKHIPELGLMFAAGVLLYAYPTKRYWALLSLGAIAAIVMQRQPFFVLLMLVPALTIAIGTANWPFLRRAGRFGDFSYGVYIYAWPVQQFGVLWFGKEQPVWLLMSLSLLLTLALAVFSWHFIEGPSLRLKNRLGRVHATKPKDLVPLVEPMSVVNDGAGMAE